MWGSLKRPSPRPTLIEECRSDDSDLCHELTDRYGFTPEEMHRAAERYHLGRSKSGKTIYWMIDELGIVRDGHLANSWVSQMLKSRCPSLKTTPLPPRNPPKSTSPTSSSNSATIPPK